MQCGGARGAIVERNAFEPCVPAVRCYAEKLLQPAMFPYSDALMAQKIASWCVVMPKNCGLLQFPGTEMCHWGYLPRE